MPKPAAPKITDFETSFDAVPVPSPNGYVIWADVRIEYLLSGLTPTVTIRIPVPWNENVTPDERKARALRCARELIDHACLTVGVQANDAEVENVSVGEALDAASPTVLEGIVQELGLAEPTAQPRKRS